MRSANGCWTCRLRRKKCDETYPVCEVCAALHITCYFDQGRPEWMDGDTRQEEMAERFRREVKDNAHLRRGEIINHNPNDQAPDTEASFDHLGSGYLPQRIEQNGDGTDFALGHSDTPQEMNVAVTTERGCGNKVFGRTDTVLSAFFLGHVVSFMQPFYRPSILLGGRSWLLEMILGSPLLRNVVLCQSCYFFSLASGADDQRTVWETMLRQTKEAFEKLRRSLKLLDDPGASRHPDTHVRIMTSILQMQRFEIAVLSFSNCQAHLNAALAIFQQLLDIPDTTGSAKCGSSYSCIMERLGNEPTLNVPGAEQSAFEFSSALLILDDIIASTIRQEKPRLYEYHRQLLDDTTGSGPLIDLGSIIGCQNWVLSHIGEISVLDAWKQERKKTGDLDVMELVRRATAIQDSLKDHFAQFQREPPNSSGNAGSFLQLFTPEFSQDLAARSYQQSTLSTVWTHAAFIYLAVVVSGWQPANAEIRHHVSQMLNLLQHHVSPPALLRTMVWPFCVAGCLADSGQETQFRDLVKALQPPRVFGAAYKALEIMENVWRERNMENSEIRDISSCFKSQGDLVLLV